MENEPIGVEDDITEKHQITRKYIFQQKLAGKPIKIPWSPNPWLEEIKHLKILLECGILEEGEGRSGRFWVRYPILFHGSNHAGDNDRWHELDTGQRLAEPGDLWEID